LQIGDRPRLKRIRLDLELDRRSVAQECGLDQAEKQPFDG